MAVGAMGYSHARAVDPSALPTCYGAGGQGGLAAIPRTLPILTQMSYQSAIAKAKRLAIRKSEWVYVVCESGEYDTATEWDLDSFYLGTEPIVAVGPDGQIEN